MSLHGRVRRGRLLGCPCTQQGVKVRLRVRAASCGKHTSFAARQPCPAVILPSTFHTMTAPSDPPVAAHVPAGSKARQVISVSCSISSNRKDSLLLVWSTRHTLTVLSHEAETNTSPCGNGAAVRTWPRRAQ